MFCQIGEVPEMAPAGLVLAGENVNGDFLRGLMVFGMPVGTDQYVSFKLNEVADQISPFGKPSKYVRCIVPPVLWPGKPDIAKHSATTPCPANAASPCINIGITLFLCLS